MGKFKQIEEEMIEIMVTRKDLTIMEVKEVLNNVAQHWGLIPDFYDEYINKLIEDNTNGK